MKVEQLMTRTVKTCTETDSLNRAAQLMWESDCGFIPVISGNGDGSLVGVITDRDIAMAAYIQGKQLWAIPAGAVMARKVIACNADDGVSLAEALMRENRVRRLAVVDRNGRLVGVLSLNDMAREAQREAAIGKRVEVAEANVGETLGFICQPRTSREMTVTA